LFLPDFGRRGPFFRANGLTLPARDSYPFEAPIARTSGEDIALHRAYIGEGSSGSRIGLRQV